MRSNLHMSCGVTCVLLILFLMGLFLTAACAVLPRTQSVVINEVLASNGTVLADEDGEYEDWIELYNPTTAPIDLDGYTLTDNPNNPQKWTFPAVTIQPQGFLLVWASGKDRRRPGAWDFRRPLILEFESKGFYDGDSAGIFVNGKDKSLNLRGINIVRLDKAGNYIESTVYDTWASSDAVDGMARYLENLSDGEILIFAVRDEASANLTPRARLALEALGSEYIGRLASWDSWGMISLVGQGKLAEDYRPRGEGAATGSIASQMTLHTDFKIDKDGEYLGLYAPNGKVVDSVRLNKQVRDVSFGRQPDGGKTWCLFTKPTPNASNDTPCSIGVAAPPTFSPTGGFYKGSVTVELTAPEKSEIHYTLDGSTPTETSPRYVDPLTIKKTEVVRARAFGAGLIHSPNITHTYLINEGVHLPVLSLATDPANLWDPKTGIYTEGPYPAYPNYRQHGREWERPVSVEFFEGGTLGFALNAGVRIFGGTTREFPKKSFILYFRKAYGQGHLNYRVFPEKDIRRFTSLVIRNAGNDGAGSLPRIRDPLMHALWAEEGGLVSAKRSVFVYLNGVPWGIYNLREHIDADYIASNLHIKDFDLITEEKTVKSGDIKIWDATLSFFASHDLSVADNYVTAQQLINIKNFTDYQIFEIYSGNIDVWGNYVRFRPRLPDGRWQWIMWDMDLTFGLGLEIGVSHNTLAWYTRDELRPDLSPAWADGDLWLTLPLRKLLGNKGYRNYFINRFADLLNTTLHPQHVIAKINSLTAIIEPDIPRDIARWRSEWGGSVNEWKANVEKMRDFARQRPYYVRQHIIEKFGLSGTAMLTIEPPLGKGSVRVNTILPLRYPWQGTYFQGVPVQLQAKPASGYKFAGWSDASLPATATVVVSLPKSYTIQATFVPDE